MGAGGGGDYLNFLQCVCRGEWTGVHVEGQFI